MIVFELFSGYEQINIINDNRFVSNTEMINQVSNQHEDPNNIENSYLDLDIKSDFCYSDKQTNVITNETLKSSVSDEVESSRKFPRIIENKKCKVNMTVLQKSVASTADDSFNTSILQESLQFSDTNISDINISDINIFDINVTDTVNNIREMNDKIPTENKFISAAVYRDSELDTTSVTLSDLNEVKSLIVNNGELYCNNPQVANVSKNTGIYIYMQDVTKKNIS